MIIRLVGPGGAGKSTVGAALAHRVQLPFVDLDAHFRAQVGDISAFLTLQGYQAYAHRNVQLYLDLVESVRGDVVHAMSSGFLTYGNGIHPGYRALYAEIVASPSTVALLPSFDCETCVAETVRRQASRPFSRSREREEQVIRARFPIYMNLPTKKVETARPVDAIVDDLVSGLR